jgi:anti-sigma regulatory factor (Ser/Thr protein kinase)
MIETLLLEHDVRAPSLARHWIMQRCRGWHCEALADSVALMTSELVTNVFLHARTDCRVEARYEAPTFSVTVTDGAIEELSPQPASVVAEEGRGLAIVEALADKWGVERNDGTKSVWFDISSDAVGG